MKSDDKKLINDINNFVIDEVPREMAVKTSPAPIQKKQLEMDEGNYTLNSMPEQLAYAQYLMDNLLVSDSFKKPSQLILAIQACKDLGLPNSALKDFYVVGGKPAIYGDTYLGLMHSSGLLDEFHVSFFDPEGITIDRPKKGQVYFGCEIHAKRKGYAEGCVIHFTLDDRDLSKTTNPTWVKFPRDMLFRRCAGRVAKWITPDAIRGLYFGDELEDMGPSKEDDKTNAAIATSVFSS